MSTLGTRTKLLFTLAIFLFVMFLVGETNAGQRFLRGTPSENPSVYADQYGSSGIMPLVYCAVPSGVLLLLSLVSYKADRRRVE